MAFFGWFVRGRLVIDGPAGGYKEAKLRIYSVTAIGWGKKKLRIYSVTAIGFGEEKAVAPEGICPKMRNFAGKKQLAGLSLAAAWPQEESPGNTERPTS